MLGFIEGFLAPPRAIALLLRSRRVLALVLMPLTINFLLYAVFFKFGIEALSQVIAAWTASLSVYWPSWAVAALQIVLKIMSWIALGLLGALSFTLVSGLASAPFNDALSRAAVRARFSERGFATAPETLPTSVPQTIFLEFKRILILLGSAVFLLGFGLIPFFQLPAVLMGAWLIAFEYLGYPISQRSHKLSDIWRFMLKCPSKSIGFGCFQLLLMAIPFASVLYIPFAVIASSTLFVDEQLKGSGAAPDAGTHRKT